MASKRAKKKTGDEELDTLLPSGLNLREEVFCKAYTCADREVYGNGVRSYILAYQKDKIIDYASAKTLAHRLLTKVHITKRINELLDEGGFNDENVDKQHLFLLNQHDDLRTKLGAIKEYNTLKKRIDSNPNVVIINQDKKGNFNKALEYLKR